ncbi:monocarboxylate transporter 13 [Bradysia coprophila]|uniref:monocarboxylate transporter 13 n=1 Tax=Bradysia coprophila TaxID=38358 RepID=UPI00187DD1B4|nr:monocarboxylate transporter 13 [Bradysia coprophila]XP_037046435.1 monocarboxylate transporter 13 [Bradysia coprophila]
MTQGDEDQDVDFSEEKLTFINGKLVPYDGAELHKKDKKTVKISSSPIKSKPTTPDKDNQEWELVPPDGGWGWLVLAGSMLVNILVPGTVKSFGVLFVEFLEAFDASPSTAAWIPALCYFLYSSLGPLSSILSVKYSYRTVTLIGGTFAAVGMMLSYWASSVTYLYISYGVFVGTGAGLSFPPTVYIVTSYFVRLRGLANGICISGSAFGSIILPPILRYLLENYGYRGAVLIMGAITLNTWVAAIFYEPVERHLKRVPKNQLETLEDAIIEEEDDGIIMEFAEQNNGDDASKPKFMITSDETPVVTPKNSLTSADVVKLPKNFENGFVRSASAAVVQNYGKSSAEEYRQRKISTPVRESSRATFANQLSSTPSLYAVPENSRFSQSSRLNRLNQLRNSGKPKRSPSTSSFQYVSTPYHGSTLSFQPQEFASHLSLKSIASSINPVSSCSKKKSDANEKAKPKFLDLSLLKDPAYLVILISNSTNAIGYTNFIILLPSYAGALGFDKDYSAYLLSIVSALDLVGRIGGSALSDTGFIPKTWYFVGGLALSGLSLATLPLFTTYSMVSLCCALFGLASGTYVGITAVIMADMLGTERLTSSYGISLFVNGILQLIGPPLCGVWYEAVNTYSPLFTTLGLILLSGASLWGFMPFILRNKLKREQENEDKQQQEEMTNFME